ncbi:unnamed protein product [Discula destructiva]
MSNHITHSLLSYETGDSAGTMGTPALPDNITLEDFQDALDRYDGIIEAVSASKSVKPGQTTLAELDRYRYTEAPALFALKKPSRPMQLQDIKTLVEWKLKHGKFRPTLMKLVSSNEASFANDTVKGAVDSYQKTSDVPATVDALAKLKGIGPATASLLLAVHDPENAIFFSDEAFYWLCSGARRGPIKYNQKEYRELNEKAQALAKRLHVKAIDVERVAYVLITDAHSAAAKKVAEAKQSATAKRKQPSNLRGDSAPRRSKRGKLA